METDELCEDLPCREPAEPAEVPVNTEPDSVIEKAID
jgi:hypothetical protein